MQHRTLHLLLSVSALSLAGAAAAQSQQGRSATAPAPVAMSGAPLSSLSGSGITGNSSVQNLPGQRLSSEIVTGSASNGNQEGMGLALRFTDTLPLHSNSVEYRRQTRFNETGQQLALQHTRRLNDRQQITVGGSVSDSFLFAKAGLTGVFEQLWTSAPQMTTRFGLSHHHMHDSQSQTALLVEQTGRTDWGLVWQAGRQFGLASPGSRSFHTTHIGLQYQSPDRWRALLRRQWSREAYQAISDTEARFDFSSQSLRVALGYPLNGTTWMQVFADRYDTPFYERRQIGLGVEQAW